MLSKAINILLIIGAFIILYFGIKFIITYSKMPSRDKLIEMHNDSIYKGLSNGKVILHVKAYKMTD